MMKGILRGERGMASVFGLCALGILMIVFATMYATSRNHMLSTRRFLARDAVRNAAEDGVRLAVARMDADSGTAAKANGAISNRESLFKTKVGDTAVEVFARKRGDEILLLGVGNKNEERARALGIVKKSGGKYIIEHWER